MKLESFSHSYRQLAYHHVVLVTKYRRRVFKTDDMKAVAELVFHDIAKDHDMRMHTIKVLEEHVHLFLNIKPTYSMSKVKQLLKGISAYKLFRIFPEIKQQEWGGHLWSKGMFICSVSSVTAEAIERYIQESQAKHPS